LSFEAFTESLLNHLESNFVLYAAELLLQGIKSRSHAHPHYSHANTKIDELKKFSKDNKTA
jgi:hypothetical protein